MTTASRIIRAPRGTSRTCKGWLQEAARRMRINSLGPDVAALSDERDDIRVTDRGATRVSVHHGGGISFSIHAGTVIVADRSREADEHPDAGYPWALESAREPGAQTSRLEAGR